MKKRETRTGRIIDVKEVETIWRTVDKYLYTVYKDRAGVYYMDACDGGPDIALLNGRFDTDEAAVKNA